MGVKMGAPDPRTGRASRSSHKYPTVEGAAANLGVSTVERCRRITKVKRYRLGHGRHRFASSWPKARREGISKTEPATPTRGILLRAWTRHIGIKPTTRGESTPLQSNRVAGSHRAVVRSLAGVTAEFTANVGRHWLDVARCAENRRAEGGRAIPGRLAGTAIVILPRTTADKKNRSAIHHRATRRRLQKPKRRR